MSQRAFVTFLIVLAAVVALSATSFPGALMGFLFAIGATFFVTVPGTIIGDAFRQAGVRVTEKELVWMLIGLYALLVLAASFQTWRQFRRRDLNEARTAGLRTVLLLALPLMGWLSTNAMVHAWP
jgi:hypothetical protein